MLAAGCCNSVKSGCALGAPLPEGRELGQRWAVGDRWARDVGLGVLGRNECRMELEQL